MKTNTKTKINFTWQGKKEVEEVSTYAFFFGGGWGGVGLSSKKITLYPFEVWPLLWFSFQSSKSDIKSPQTNKLWKFTHPSTFSIFLDGMLVTCVASDF